MTISAVLHTPYANYIFYYAHITTCIPRVYPHNMLIILCIPMDTCSTAAACLDVRKYLSDASAARFSVDLENQLEGAK